MAKHIPAGIRPRTGYIFKDVNGETETYFANSEDEAWLSLAKDLGATVEAVKMLFTVEA